MNENAFVVTFTGDGVDSTYTRTWEGMLQLVQRGLYGEIFPPPEFEEEWDRMKKELEDSSNWQGTCDQPFFRYTQDFEDGRLYIQAVLSEYRLEGEK